MKNLLKLENEHLLSNLLHCTASTKLVLSNFAHTVSTKQLQVLSVQDKGEVWRYIPSYTPTIKYFDSPGVRILVRTNNQGESKQK